MRLLISAGGTGGGIYPALAVVEALQRVAPDAELHYVGSVGGMEDRLVPREMIDGYHAIYAGPVNGVGVLRLMSSLLKIAAGTLQALALTRRLRPAALFMTGGWATLPISVACWLLRVPILIFLPDIEPALTIKAISRLAKLVLTSTGDSARFFPAGTPVREIGYPLRREVLRATRDDGLAHFKLDPQRQTVLVWGGSRGARSINEALHSILPALLESPVQIIHVSGELDAPQVMARRDTLSPALKQHYQVYAYLKDDMGLAMAAADVVVSRAGASALGELPHFGLPGILVPYPFAWDYQKTNADWLASRGAAIRLDDDRMAADLLPTLRVLLGDPARLDTMRKAARALARTDAAGDIARQVIANARR